MIVTDRTGGEERDVGRTMSECSEGGLTPPVRGHREVDTVDELDDLAFVRPSGSKEGVRASVAEGKEGRGDGLAPAAPEEITIAVGCDGHYGQTLSIDRQGMSIVGQGLSNGLISAESLQGGHRSSPLQRTLSEPGIGTKTNTIEKVRARSNSSTEKSPSVAASAGGGASAGGTEGGSVVRHLFVDGGDDGHDYEGHEKEGHDGVHTGVGAEKEGRGGVSLIADGPAGLSGADREGVLVGMTEVLRLLKDADEQIQRVASGLTPPRAVPALAPESESSFSLEQRVSRRNEGEDVGRRGSENDDVDIAMIVSRGAETGVMGGSDGGDGIDFGIGGSATVAQVARWMAERMVTELGLGLGGSGGCVVIPHDTDNNNNNNNNNNDDQFSLGFSHFPYTLHSPTHPHNQPSSHAATIPSNQTTAATTKESSGWVMHKSPASHSQNSPKLKNIPKPILQRISVGIITSQIKQVRSITTHHVYPPPPISMF